MLRGRGKTEGLGLWTYYPLLMREQGSATRLVTERTLRQAGVKFTAAMELDHIEAIKQAVIAGLAMAFVSMYAVRGEIETRRLCGTASGRAFMDLLEASGRTRPPRGARRRTDGPTS